MFRRNNRNVTFRLSVVAGLLLGALFAALCVLPACSINTSGKGKDGENVDIKSPVGDLHVSDAADTRDLGLTVYPGAKPVPKEDSDDKESANINLSVRGYTLKVAAAEFISDDAPEKVIAYYDKELQKYGKPIQCRGAWKMNFNFSASPSNASKPVWCDISGKGDAVELKVGTEGNQHVVAFKPRDRGSRFALVYVRVHTGKEDTI